MTDKERFREELARLTEIDGVSGHEQGVVAYLRERMAELADEVRVDSLGNLYALRRGGGGPHFLLEAHSDEIGALVSDVTPEGFLRFQVVGGTSELMLVGRKVRVAGHRGVVGVRPGHIQSEAERRSVPGVEDLYVDLGVASRSDVDALGVRPGDQITWQSELERTANPDRVVGKGVDNRTGCLVLLEVLRALREQEMPGPLTAAVAVQEEVGMKGARVVAERTHPDAALVIDTVPCADTPDARVNTFPVRLGGGPVFQVSSGRQSGGYLMPETVRGFLIRVAEEAGIPYQLATFAYGNTDASSIYDSAGGVPTAVATVPRRYSHSPVEMLDLNDALAMIQLCLEVVRRVREFPTGLLGEEAGSQSRS